MRTDALTLQERSVLEHAADGSSTRETARAMIVAAETVKGYRRQLFQKLEAKNIAHAVAIAFRTGLLKPKVLAPVATLPDGTWAVSGTVEDGRLLLAFLPVVAVG